MAAERQVQVWLSDILTAIVLVDAFKAGLTFEAYEASALHRSAIERQVGIIGEAVNQIRLAEPNAPISELNRLNRFRNRIIHEYSQVTPAVVWQMITEALPRLEQEA